MYTCTMYTGSEIAYRSRDAIRHVKCHLLFVPGSIHKEQCPVCAHYRENYLRKTLNRIKQGKENSDHVKLIVISIIDI